MTAPDILDIGRYKHLAYVTVVNSTKPIVINMNSVVDNDDFLSKVSKEALKHVQKVDKFKTKFSDAKLLVKKKELVVDA